MKNRFAEGIRKNLIKIILPYRKRRDALLSKFHLSITNRIAVNYLKLLIINGFLFFALFFVFYIMAHISPYSSLAENVLVNLKTAEGSFMGEINPYKDRGIFLEVFEKTEEKENQKIYSDSLFDLVSYYSFFEKVYYAQDTDCMFIMTQETVFNKEGKTYLAKFYFDMTGEYGAMWRLFWNLVLVYVILVFFIIREGKSDNVKMLIPIREMTETVNRLTMLNIHSERLNVAGTKNELKELAEVFNEMLDRMEAAYEGQKQFVSDASHELRTPIAVVQGYANMLSRWGAKDEEVLQESIEALQGEARMMQDLVEKLLFLSRHDKKTLKLNKEMFPMRPVVEDMVKETGMVVKNRVIECSILEDVQVYGDKQSLKQAIRVLIDNAVKYSSDGDKVIISCKNVNGDCVIGVEDTGIGMTKKDLDHIFNRFYRSDDVRNRKIDGHGLGLSIARLIIMAHTGRIYIRSQYTKGTKFLVTIPRRRY